MKKLYRFIMLAMLLVLFDGCTKGKENKEEPSVTLKPTSQAVVSQPEVTKPVTTMPSVTLPPNPQQGSNTDNGSQQDKELAKYLFMPAGSEYVYEGDGNEYAAFQSTVDYINSEKNIIQVRSNNGGTETVEVIQVKDGKLVTTYREDECYYRDNFFDKVLADKDQEVLLMNPLKVGTKWTLGDGTKRSITSIDSKVKTPSGDYGAIEVTSVNKDGTEKEYYAQGVGLVKKVYESGKTKVTSILSKINKNKPFIQKINVYYPDKDEKIHVEQLTLSLNTNDVTRIVLEKALREKAKSEDYLPIISTNTKINSMHKGKDGIAYIDFSGEFIHEMSSGSGYESLILQCITNTVGNYYDTSKVYITIDGKLYESGHIIMKKGETFKVNMKNVVK